ncbi:MAG: sensor histidine kinase [Planctomycetota bacterium]
MRDPLAWLPIRYKLTLTFVGLCLLAYGVGGWLVSNHAQDVLRAEILHRLASSSRSQAEATDEAMQRLEQRAEDFCSDGLIRSELARLASVEPGLLSGEAERLRTHLATNKLPLEESFLDLVVYAADGRRLTGVRDRIPSGTEALLTRGLGHDETLFGGFLAPNDLDSGPNLVLTSPVLRLDGAGRIGTLACWIDVATWLATVPRPGEAESPERRWMTIHDGRGAALVVDPAPRAGERGEGGTGVLRIEPLPGTGTTRTGTTGRERIGHGWPLSHAGWRVELEVSSREALAPVAGLQSRFLAAGLLIAAAAAVLLFFPLRFLVRPLGLLRDAARRLTEGDLSVRVDVDTRDEVGELANAFNHMADAVGERAARLEQAAAALQARKDELSQERDRLDAMVRSMQDAVVFLDDGGKVLLSNAAAAPLLKILGASEGRDLAVRCGIGGDEHPRDCVGCLTRGTQPRRTCRIDVGNRVYEVVASRIPSALGWMGRLLVGRDITEHVTIDEREAHQGRLAVVGEVAAVVAHELNNPLSAIAMYAQMMEKDLEPSSPHREHVDVIRRNTETCTRAIRGLLDYAHDTGPEIADVDLEGLLDDVARFVRPLLQRAAVTLERRGRFDDPYIRADEVQLRQVLVNLVMNAIQAVQGIGRRVEIDTQEGDDGRTVLIDVTDDGPGIPEEDRERIFETFVTTKGPGHGTGLGLAISRRIVDAHGGALTLECAEPGRTTFRVSLQRAPRGGVRRSPQAARGGAS